MGPALKAIIAIASMVTVYGPELTGNPLYCDRGDGLIYGQVDIPWIALDVSEYRSGRVHCGDRIRVVFADGQVYDAWALDAGRYYPLVGHLGLPMVGDLPTHQAPFDGTAAVHQILNLTTLRDALE